MIKPAEIPMRDLFKPSTVAELFSVPRATVYRWIERGNINAEKYAGIVRIPREAIVEFINNGHCGVVVNTRKTIGTRMAANLRARFHAVIKGKVKADATLELVGCSLVNLMAHLEKHFKAGMTWQNYGKNGWVIDHIIPCAHFDMSDSDHQKVCFHYTNLQPLWFGENSSKGKKYTRRNIRKVIRISNAIS